MSVNLMLGNLLIAFGVMKLGLFFFGKRLTLARLEALKARFGSRRGTWFYLFIYAVVPIAFGMATLLREYRLPH